MPVKTFTTLISIVIFIFVIELIRRQKMTFKYSMFWLAACGTALFLTYNDFLLKKLTQITGFELTSNFIFFLLLVFFIFLSLRLTIYINEQSNRSDLLAQTVGILEHKLKHLEEKLKSSKDARNH